MLRKNIYPPLVVTIVILFSLTSCSEKEEAYPAVPEDPVFVTASTEDGAGGTMYNRKEVMPAAGEESKPWVFLEPEEILLRSMEVNLDIDVSDEQILILKHKSETDAPIIIAIVDFDPVLNVYKRTWQHSTPATNIRAFSLSLSDIIGDHKLELVCFGSDADGNQTLSVFWRQRSSEGPELFYEPVCEISVSGSIEIIEKQRSDAYEAGMKDGESFPIVTREHSGESDNILDIIESTYFWDFKNRRYIKIQEEFIPGDRIEEDRLTSLFKGSDEDFLDFFDGAWYLSGTRGETDGNETILFFETDKKRMVLYSGNVQEIYRWDGITRSLKNSLFFQGSNELMSYITNEVYIRIQSMDTLSVTLRDIDSQTRIKTTNENWSGTYVRLSESSLNQIADRHNGIHEDDLTGHADLIGQYIADDGSRIIFNKPFFNRYAGQETESGSFSIYSTGDSDYIEFRVFDDSRVPVKKLVYRLEYSEKMGVTEIIRTIKLIPGRMSADGFVMSGDGPLRYEQIESLETEE